MQLKAHAAVTPAQSAMQASAHLLLVCRHAHTLLRAENYLTGKVLRTHEGCAPHAQLPGCARRRKSSPAVLHHPLCRRWHAYCATADRGQWCNRICAGNRHTESGAAVCECAVAGYTPTLHALLAYLMQ
jgi:hypothetical protein